jgi:hypothetical protein
MATGTVTNMEQRVQTLSIEKEMEIAGSIDIVFETLLEQIGPLSETPDGELIPMTLELWPGGRWYRDLGNGAGWCWGHVQVIEPPTLLELWGPHFLEYPALVHLRYRLTEKGDTTLLAFTYRVIGQIEEADRVTVGRCELMQRVRHAAERRSLR